MTVACPVCATAGVPLLFGSPIPEAREAAGGALTSTQQAVDAGLGTAFARTARPQLFALRGQGGAGQAGAVAGATGSDRAAPARHRGDLPSTDQ